MPIDYGGVTEVALGHPLVLPCVAAEADLEIGTMAEGTCSAFVAAGD